MRQLIVALFLLSNSSGVTALEFSSAIHSISFGQEAENHLIRFDNGRVSFIESEDLKLISFLASRKEKHEVVEVHVDKNNILQTAKAVATSSSVKDDTMEGWSFKADPYMPSVLKDWNSALGIFNKMRKDLAAMGSAITGPIFGRMKSINVQNSIL